MNTATQTAQILKHLRSGKHLTPIEALKRFGTLRLASRILELKRDGYDIKSKRVELASGKRVASYRLS